MIADSNSVSNSKFPGAKPLMKSKTFPVLKLGLLTGKAFCIYAIVNRIEALLFSICVASLETTRIAIVAANLAAHPGHEIILMSQFCGVVSFFEYGRDPVEEHAQATMEGKTLLNKS